MSASTSFDSLYPGRFIKAGEFGGKTPTVTIKAIHRDMLANGSGSEEPAVIVEFNETDKSWVMVKTNGVCLRAMFGDDYSEWIGKRITLHAVKDTSGLSESGLCIRVLGAPHLDKPLKFKARLGRKMVTQTLHPTGNGKAPETYERPNSSPSDASVGVGQPEPYDDPANGVVDEDGEVFEFADGPA